MEEGLRSHPLYYFNRVKAGLNFILPSCWYSQLEDLNKQLGSLQSFRFPATEPLRQLVDFQILIYEAEFFNKQFQALCSHNFQLMNTFQQVMESLASQVNNDLEKKKKISKFFYPRLPTKLEDYRMVLFAPQINLSLIKQIEIGWYVVSPRFYRRILQHFNSESNHNNACGLPIFLKDTPQIYPVTYSPDPQLLTRLSFNNSQRHNYALIGFVDKNTNIGDLLHQTYEGLQELCEDANECCPQIFRNQVYVNDRNFYYKFSENWMEKLPNSLIPLRRIEKKRICEFSNRNFVEYSHFCNIQQIKQAYIEEEYVREAIMNDSDQRQMDELERKQGRKRIKMVDETSSAFSQIVNIQSMSPLLVQSDSKGLNDQLSVSTEIDTPDHFQFNEPQCIYRCSPPDRLEFSLWKSVIDPFDMVKLAEISMQKVIPIPFSSSRGRTYIQVQDGLRICFQHSCNRLTLNGDSLEQIQQKQICSKLQSNQRIIQDLEIVAQQLQNHKFRHYQKAKYEEDSQMQGLTSKYGGPEEESSQIE